MFKHALLACILVLEFSNAQATLIIDQENPAVTVNGFCNMWINRHQECGQSFMQDNSNLAGIGIHINLLSSASDGTLTISVYDSYGPTLGNLITFGTSGTINSDSGWVDVFWPAIDINSASTYYFVLTSSQDYLTPTYTDNLYSKGHTLAFKETDAYYLQYDLNFRTYYDDTYHGTVDATEPSSIALMSLSLLGFSFLRKNKEKYSIYNYLKNTLN
jgi:hypothetical protein